MKLGHDIKLYLNCGTWSRVTGSFESNVKSTLAWSIIIPMPDLEGAGGQKGRGLLRKTECGEEI